MFKGAIIVLMILVFSWLSHAQEGGPVEEFKMSKKAEQEAVKIGKGIDKIEKHCEVDTILKTLGLYPISKYCRHIVIQVNEVQKNYYYEFSEYQLSICYAKLSDGKLKLKEISLVDAPGKKVLHEKVLK